MHDADGYDHFGYTSGERSITLPVNISIKFSRSCDFQTVNSEAFLLYHLAKNPRTQRKVYDEIISVLSNDNSSFTEKSLKNMPYLKACIQETLRYYYSFGCNEFNLRKNCIINIKRIVRFKDCTPRFRTSQDSYQKLYPFMDTQYLKG